MLTIRNLTKRTVVLNLPHAEACSETQCTCSRVKVGVEDLDPITGERKVRAVNQRLGASVTLFPKGSRGQKGEELDRVDVLDTVRRVQDVISAERRGEIRVEEAAKPKPVEPAPEPSAAPTKDATPTKTKAKE